MNNDLISRKALVAALIKEREQYPPMVAERYSFGVKLPHSFNQAMRGGIRKALRLVETAPAVEYYGNIDVSANAVFDGMTRADGPRFRETDEMCPQCQRDLEVYYCENRTYAVRCRHCKTIALVSAVNADEAASKIGLHVKPVRHGRWIPQDNTFTRYMCSECESKNHGGHEKYCPNCGTTMDMEG